MAQLDDDALQAVLCARNCLLYERDDGPPLLNVGSVTEPRRIPRAEAWQHAYAMIILVDCDGDRDRLSAASKKCREDAGRARRAYRARALSRAADLCDQAINMIEGAGADHDHKGRRRLVAACRHETAVISRGAIQGVAEASAAELIERLRQIDEEP
jgi:hypothetical protein